MMLAPNHAQTGMNVLQFPVVTLTASPVESALFKSGSILSHLRDTVILGGVLDNIG